MLKLAGVGLALVLALVMVKIAPHIQKARREHVVAQGLPPALATPLKRHQKAGGQGDAGRRNNLDSMHAKSPGTVTAPPPRGRLPHKSSRNKSSARAIWPAPAGAPVLKPPPPAAKPAKTPPSAPRITSSAIVAALPPPAPARADLRVHLGTVKSKARAVREARRLIRAHKSALDGLKIELVRADLGGRGVYYRLLAGPVSNNTAADSLCRQLTVRNQNCFVIEP